MPKIVISYRRADSAAITGRIYDRLIEYYEAGSIFMDIDAIPLGFDFREFIDDALATTDILIAVVGPGWIGDSGQAGSRIGKENDYVRIEVETALKRTIPVIPVLVDKATMPLATRLPRSLKGFSFRHSASIDSGIDFHTHVDRLIRSMDQILEKKYPGFAKKKPLPAAAPWLSAGSVIAAGIASAGKANAELGSYSLEDFRAYVGKYIFVRPASADRKRIFLYPFLIEWDEEKPGLLLREYAEKREASAQFGFLSIPRSSMHVFITSNEAGWIKLAALSQLDRRLRMRGVLLTIGGATGGVYVPTVMPVILRKVRKYESTEARTLTTADAEFKEFGTELAQVVTEKYVRIIRMTN